MTPAEIKEIRLAVPLTQTEMATIIGVSIQTIRNWEAGRRSPRLHHERSLRALVAEQAPEVVNCRQLPTGCACRCHGGPTMWTHDEIAYLRREIELSVPPAKIALSIATVTGRARSVSAIVNKAQELGLSWRVGWYTESEVKRLLGVNHHRIRRWREAGLLVSRRHEAGLRGRTSHWRRIDADVLDAFVVQHAGVHLNPTIIRDRALRTKAELAAAVNRRRAS